MFASVEVITVKNRGISTLFSVIGQSPRVEVTRWLSWLNAALYYFKHLPIIKNIISVLVDNGILIKNAKNSLSNPNLFKDIV